MQVFSIALAFVLDLIFGDPPVLTHPVVIMGRFISDLERRLRVLFPDNEKGLLMAGRVLAFVMPVGTFLVTGGVLWLAGRIHPVAALTVNTIWCYQAIAVRDMLKESRGVKKALEQEGLHAGQTAVARIVGRDTSVLDEKGILRACVETVAENFSDGVMAPLFYMALGGAPLALAYKAVNTMDSMVGYKNDRYLWFGRAAAHLDDAAGFVPARLGAFVMMAAALMTGKDAAGAARIWKRDRLNHASPNSAQTESVMAGALGLRLAGPAVYFGRRCDKPYIGDARREISTDDIDAANRIFLVSSILGVALACVLAAVVPW